MFMAIEQDIYYTFIYQESQKYTSNHFSKKGTRNRSEFTCQLFEANDIIASLASPHKQPHHALRHNKVVFNPIYMQISLSLSFSSKLCLA